jgi:hypothetical protein
MPRKKDPTKPSRTVGPINSRGKLAVPVNTRSEAELLARWVEGKFDSYPQLIAREAAWLLAHPDDKDSKGRLVAYRYAYATAQQIAYWLRTHRVRGPVDG